MGWKSSFKMGKTYGADDLNEITKTFVSGGVADTFENGLPYNLSKINDVISGVAASGAVPETVTALKVIFKNEKVKISPGRAVMNDGSICIVDDDGVLLDYTQNSVNYVYILNDTTANDNIPMCTTAEPNSTSDVVMLAKIDENGNITDKRNYAKGKSTAQSSNLMGMTFYTELEPYNRIVTNGTRTTIVCDNITGYTKAVILWEYNTEDRRYAQTMIFFDFETGISYGSEKDIYNDHNYSEKAASGKRGILYYSFAQTALYLNISNNKLEVTEDVKDFSNYPSRHPEMPIIKIWLFK